MTKIKTETYSQASSMPTQKVAAAGISGAVSIVLIYIASQLGLELPAEVAAAITTIVSFASGYLVKEKRLVVEEK